MSSNPMMNQAIRAMGNRSRAVPDVPDIGQGRPTQLPPQANPAAPAYGLTGTQPAGSPSAVPSYQNATRIPQAQQIKSVPQPPVVATGSISQIETPGQLSLSAPYGNQPQMGRPTPNPFQVETPGQPAPADHYNYEPGSDGSWRVYPPGLPAPAHVFTASMPRAASTADYGRMRAALQYHMTPQPPV
jgi:hypothetical protein